MKPTDKERLVIRDAAGRRRFIRTSTAFVLSAGAAMAASTVRADECDQARGGEKSGQAAAGSDSDAGTSADPAGCGRRSRDTPKISLTDDDQVQPGPMRPVAKVKA